MTDRAEETAREIFELTRYDSNPEAVEAAFATALRQAYAQGVEEAARVATAYGEDELCAAHSNQAVALNAASNIASDIRALLPKDDAGKGEG